MTKKIIEIEDIGTICLYKHKTAKCLRIIMRPEKPPRVTIPTGLSFKAAEDFVYSKSFWIKETLEKIRLTENKRKKVSAEDTEVLRFRAKSYLPARIEELSRKHGLNYNKIFIKNLKSRWGSCSAKNNINLNLHLMRLPENLIDYVLLHELAHTKEKNHGKNFRNLLNIFMPNAKFLDKELKNYSASFYEKSK